MVHVYYEIKEIIKNGRKNLLMTTIKVLSVSKKNCYDIKTGSSDRQTYLSASGWINQARKSPQIQVIFLRQGLRLVFSSCARDSCFSRMNNHRLHLPLLMFLNVFSYVHAHKPYALRLILNRFAKMELFLTQKFFLTF